MASRSQNAPHQQYCGEKSMTVGTTPPSICVPPVQTHSARNLAEAGSVSAWKQEWYIILRVSSARILKVIACPTCSAIPTN